MGCRAIPFLKSQLEGGRAEEKFSRPTMEKAAVACAAIENFYDDLYKTLREREARRQTLEVKMQQKALPADEKERWRKQLQSQVRSKRERARTRVWVCVSVIERDLRAAILLLGD